MILSNLHTHTKYCDGKNTPEEIVLCAISSGFSSVGFSGHGYTPFDNSYCMSQENTQKYLDEIKALKEKYKDSIEIYAGLEADLYSEFHKENFEYIIGSCHYIKSGNTFLPIDNSEETTKKFVTEYFSGDYLKYAEVYFETVSKLPSLKPDIIGHFDLVTKYNEGFRYFDETDKKYIDLAYTALDTIVSECNLFELNTGAVARGHKSSPYPAFPLLKRLKEKGARIIINSDCHNKAYLNYYYNESAEILKEAGFLSATVLHNGKFIEYSL